MARHSSEFNTDLASALGVPLREAENVTLNLPLRAYIHQPERLPNIHGHLNVEERSVRTYVYGFAAREDRLLSFIVIGTYANFHRHFDVYALAPPPLAEESVLLRVASVVRTCVILGFRRAVIDLVDGRN